jgi:hypothetical protein
MDEITPVMAGTSRRPASPKRLHDLVRADVDSVDGGMRVDRDALRDDPHGVLGHEIGSRSAVESVTTRDRHEITTRNRSAQNAPRFRGQGLRCRSPRPAMPIRVVPSTVHQ